MLQLPMIPSSPVWVEVKDGHPLARAIFRRHYSYRAYADGRDPQLFVGHGQKMVLVSRCCRALFIWRKFISGDGQQGVNCAAFRNEGAGLASELIQEAMRLAWLRWPGERFYTYVNPKRVGSGNPGYCFKRAGWKSCGITKWNKLLILEAYPHEAADEAA